MCELEFCRLQPRLKHLQGSSTPTQQQQQSAASSCECGWATHAKCKHCAFRLPRCVAGDLLRPVSQVFPLQPGANSTLTYHMCLICRRAAEKVQRCAVSPLTLPKSRMTKKSHQTLRLAASSSQKPHASVSLFSFCFIALSSNPAVNWICGL